MNDTTPFDCPDCTLTVKHDHPKPMLLVAREQMAIAAERAAEALEDAADDIPARAEVSEVKQMLRDKAAALRTSVAR